MAQLALVRLFSFTEKEENKSFALRIEDTTVVLRRDFQGNHRQVTDHPSGNTAHVL